MRYYRTDCSEVERTTATDATAMGEYVNEGFMRFVTGQYSNGLPLAMMLGRVMNSHSDRARRT